MTSKSTPDYLKERAKFLTECVKVIAGVFVAILSATTVSLIKVSVDTLEHPNAESTESKILLWLMVVGLVFSVVFAWIMNEFVARIEELLDSLKSNL